MYSQLESNIHLFIYIFLYAYAILAQFKGCEIYIVHLIMYPGTFTYPSVLFCFHTWVASSSFFFVKTRAVQSLLHVFRTPHVIRTDSRACDVAIGSRMRTGLSVHTVLSPRACVVAADG